MAFGCVGNQIDSRCTQASSASLAAQRPPEIAHSGCHRRGNVAARPRSAQRYGRDRPRDPGHAALPVIGIGQQDGVHYYVACVRLRGVSPCTVCDACNAAHRSPSDRKPSATSCCPNMLLSALESPGRWIERCTVHYMVVSTDTHLKAGSMRGQHTQCRSFDGEASQRTTFSSSPPVSAIRERRLLSGAQSAERTAVRFSRTVHRPSASGEGK